MQPSQANTIVTVTINCIHRTSLACRWLHYILPELSLDPNSVLRIQHATYFEAYYLSYRAAVGFDSGLPTDMSNQVSWLKHPA